jgi:hypothetical protein
MMKTQRVGVGDGFFNRKKHNVGVFSKTKKKRAHTGVPDSKEIPTLLGPP